MVLSEHARSTRQTLRHKSTFAVFFLLSNVSHITWSTKREKSRVKISVGTIWTSLICCPYFNKKLIIVKCCILYFMMKCGVNVLITSNNITYTAKIVSSILLFSRNMLLIAQSMCYM